MGKLLPVLDASAQGYSTNDNDFQWTHTFGRPIGRNGLIIIAGTGQETGGEENPEEINVIYFIHPINGWTAATKIADANIQESGYSLYSIKYSELPAGTTSVVIGINYKDNPKTPNVCRGISASFRNVKDQVREAHSEGTRQDGNGGHRPATITTLTYKALVIGYFGERTAVSFSDISSPAFSLIRKNEGGENNGYQGLYYRTVNTPGSVTFEINPTNPEANAVFVVAFEAANGGGAALFGIL
jgi:hypothetical protein